MKKTIIIFLSFLLLASCSGHSNFDCELEVEEIWEPELFLKDSKKVILITNTFSSKNENTNMNVNAYLWRASINLLSIAPILSTDAWDGVIINNWYNDKDIKIKELK